MTARAPFLCGVRCVVGGNWSGGISETGACFGRIARGNLGLQSWL